MLEALPIKLSAEQRGELERRVRSQTIDARAAGRARIILLASEGTGNHEIARRLEISRNQVIAWRKRFVEEAFDAIESDRPRSGRRARIDPAKIIRRTTQTMPVAATQRSTRTLVAQIGISDTTVQQVRKSNGIKPHLFPAAPSGIDIPDGSTFCVKSIALYPKTKGCI